ncbi:hypothetical protein LTR72_008054 [Exophiala xenobiotica]|nr:hypothetical protein LTR72_008054 [Exophiala xenobiotica]KAK5288108.1 hypothetical protein LTR14_008445 [Exophiala xenobiotica]KAK5401960.1 hypothetical protein LTR06_010661 [Exophiala xenobiotica]KAK5477594.1 hypothetical protein LTR55_008186 [Exophiala xenobiotica]
MCSELFKKSLPFSQAILQSGVAPLTVRTMKHHQDSYDKLVAHFKIDYELSPEQKLEALRNIPADDIVKGYVSLGSPVKSWQAAADGYLLKEVPSFSKLSSIHYPKSIKRLLIGDCAAEGLIFIMKVKQMQWTFEGVQALAVQILGEETSKRVLEAFGIRLGLSPEELLGGVTRLLTDAEWAQPVEIVARSFSNGEVFYYHVAEGNPFDGPHKGKAHHAVDLLFIFLSYQEHLPGELRQLAEKLAEHWLVFITGGRPWTPYDAKVPASAKLMQYGPNAQVREIPEVEKQSYSRLRLCEGLQDDISALAAALRGEEIVE